MRELHWYRLDEQRHVIPMDWTDRAAFVALFQDSHGRVGLTWIDDVSKVSTVFLPIDSSFGIGPPLVFETLVFGGPYDQQGERYSSWQAAEEGHQRWVAHCRQRAEVDRYIASLERELA